MASTRPRISCRNLFKQLEILSLPCQYILSIMNLNVNDQEIFQTNSFIHNNNTKNKHHLHRPNDNLFSRRTFYAGINIFKSLTPSVTVVKNENPKFKAL